MLEPNDILAVDDAVAEPDEVDFMPDADQLARVRSESGMPRWLIAGLAAAAILTVLLLMRPGPSVAHAAEVPAEAAKPEHQDLFQLPQWHDTPEDAAADAAALKASR